MSPQALRRRMAHGNIYAADKVDTALSHYFREGNLAALRELALLWLADRVDEGLDRYRERARHRRHLGHPGAGGGRRLRRGRSRSPCCAGPPGSPPGRPAGSGWRSTSPAATACSGVSADRLDELRADGRGPRRHVPRRGRRRRGRGPAGLRPRRQRHPGAARRQPPRPAGHPAAARRRRDGDRRAPATSTCTWSPTPTPGGAGGPRRAARDGSAAAGRWPGTLWRVLGTAVLAGLLLADPPTCTGCRPSRCCSCALVVADRPGRRAVAGRASAALLEQPGC